jgi:hypothetical protein
MATTMFHPTYRPFKSTRHPIMGVVDHYITKVDLREDGRGAQATFLRNNASPNRVREYGIKLFPTASQAFAAYQRQKIAAAAGAAPPVRRMVCFVAPGIRYDWEKDRYVRVARITYWGYQTSIAYGIGTTSGVSVEAEDLCDHRRITESGVRRLFLTLKHLSIAGTQRDHDPIGSVRRRSIRMTHDLHEDNVGFWRKRPVCIDFGHHIIQEAQ